MAPAGTARSIAIASLFWPLTHSTLAVSALNTGTKGSTARFAERDSKKTIVGGHLKASSFLNHTTAVQDRINGLCTPCHDPHGVSPTLGGKQAYAVPMLKGTWMTSPYKEDAPPPDPSGSNITNGPDGRPRSWGKAYGHPTPTQPIANYNIDRTTFGGSTRISEKDDQFAGLCLRCHKKDYLTDGSNKNQSWKSIDRIHESVKGWGANTEHSYTCSKCHQPHNSGLPRLMQTNCFELGPSGLRENSGLSWLPWKSDDNKSSKRTEKKTTAASNSKNKVVGCHVRQFGKTTATSANDRKDNQWQQVSKW